jgi:8-oxo-dGTP pyrophosphatase MutT (NUDIX family)
MTAPGEHRETARVLLRNPNGDVFLLLTHFDPEVGLPARWITPGGGIEPGENVFDAAVRELYEETGLIVTQAELGEPIATLSGKWVWADNRNFHTYRDTFYELIVPEFELDNSAWTKEEHRDVIDHKWWSLSDLVSKNLLIGPHGLVDFLFSR